ncbi:serine--tRNA ligase [Mesoplasma syrphidae]|uniref:Serine--tRNA ligase n=1 Tax=Mesoplasma syrphidae TaxID=225999 RepID=A0A2K9C167_9MOLU|nr:serine--tRNA ligase [Mesoplasma syrphidae]AUF83219.1 serine--tRNA ligase [Mesoplasma syrphidae]
MIDINYVEQNLKEVTERLNSRTQDYTNDLIFAVEKNIARKQILKEVEEVKSSKNLLSKEIGQLLKNNNHKEAKKAKEKVSQMNIVIEKLDKELKKVEAELENKLRYIPNIPNLNMPIGNDDNDNVEVRRFADDKIIKHQTPHWEIASKLNLVDFEAGPKLSGSRFLVYTGLGSKIVRVIADILLSAHTKRGYKEMFVPVIVNSDAMFGTGNLPKFEDDAYKIGDQYLIPTAEVPLTNLHANEILDNNQLPIKYTSFTQCFRQEAGSAGRDTKGMIRLHQFNKVELVKLVHPETSDIELENLVKDAENVLQLFELPYRVVELCTGDVGFSSMKTYDLEVWFPEQNKYREISSCSNCGDFQSRNMSTRFKDSNGKTKLVHTLNGSGVAIDRLFAAILENYWDGEKLVLPKVMRPYFDNQEFLK